MQNDEHTVDLEISMLGNFRIITFMLIVCMCFRKINFS